MILEPWQIVNEVIGFDNREIVNSRSSSKSNYSQMTADKLELKEFFRRSL